MNEMRSIPRLVTLTYSVELNDWSIVTRSAADESVVLSFAGPTPPAEDERVDALQKVGVVPDDDARWHWNEGPASTPETGGMPYANVWAHVEQKGQDA